MARNTEGMSPPISHPTEGATVQGYSARLSILRTLELKPDKFTEVIINYFNSCSKCHVMSVNIP